MAKVQLRGSVNRRVANVTTVGQEAIQSFGELSGKESSQPIDGSSKALIASSFPLAQVREMIAGRHLWFRELGRPERRLLELPTGHWPMFSRPFDLAEVLLRLAPSAVDRGTNLRK